MKFKINPTLNILKKALHLILIFGMVFNYVPIVQAQEEPAEKEIPIKGEWDVNYTDKYLKVVKGKATVSEDGQSATVTYTHPKTKKEYTLKSTSIKREINKITIKLEGESPPWDIQDGLNYPHVPVVVNETSSKLKAEYGESNNSVAFGPRKPSELNVVTLEMNVVSHDQMGGRWYYHADEVTFSDTDGYGRHGDVFTDDEGRTINQGGEMWSRPKPKIYGIFTLEDQLDNNRGITAFHYPFGSKPLNIGKQRYLFIFGENLPKKFTDPVNIEHDDEDTIYYGNPIKMEAISGNSYAKDQFTRGLKKLFESLPESEHERAKKFDALIIRADLKDGVLPGYHTFKLNGVEKGWLLQFGDNGAQIGFSRAIRQPTGIPLYEWTKDLLLPEVVYLEVLTNTDLPVDEIPVTVGVDGKIVNLAGGSKIIAKRAKDSGLASELAGLKEQYKNETDQDIEIELRERIKKVEAELHTEKRTYRTKALTLKKGVANKQNSNYNLIVQPRSKVTAFIAEPGLISVDPPVASATVWQATSDIPVAEKTEINPLDSLSVATTIMKKDDTPINARWEDYLQKAYNCDDDREDVDWTKIEYAKSDDINSYVVLDLTKLSTRINLGDHAAMIMLRQTFLGLIEKKDKEFAKMTDDAAIEGFRRYIEPYVWNENYAIAHVMVQGKDGGEIFFAETFLEDGLKHSHKHEKEEHKKWIKKATIEAIKKLREQLRKAYDFAKEKDVCDVEEMMELTGVGFGRISGLAASRLMRLNEDPSKLAGWVPHYPARGFIKRLPILWDTVKLHENMAEHDTSMLLLTTAILAMPVMMWGGTAGIVAGIVVDVLDIAVTSYMEVSRAYENDVEVEFALAASEVLGEQRKRIADARDITWTKAAAAIILSGIGIIFGVDEYGKLYRTFTTPSEIVRIARGRKLADTLKDGSYKALPDSQKQDLLAFVVDAHRKQSAIGILDEIEEAALDSLKAMDVFDDAAFEAPSWMGKVGDDVFAMLEPLLHRGDIHKLMDDAADLVASALRGKDAEDVMKLLRYAPFKTREQFQAALDAMRKRVKEPKGEDFYKQADEADADVLKKLEDNGWTFSGSPEQGKRAYNVTYTGPLKEPDPATGATHGSGTAYRGFDEAEGTLELAMVFRSKAPPWIKEGLDIPLVEGKGVPTIMFVNMRFMNAFGIGYAGKGGKLLKKVEIEHVVNARTCIQLEWMRRTYFPNKTFKEMVADGSINELLRHTFTVQYAEGAITMAGYRIKEVRLKFDEGILDELDPVEGYKAGYKGSEPWEEMLSRYDMDESDTVVSTFDIEIIVEPI